MKVGVTVMKFRGCFARGCRLPSEAPVLGPGTCALDQHVQWKILALHLNDLKPRAELWGNAILNDADLPASALRRLRLGSDSIARSS
jgi:hypothetical protein